MSDLSKLSVQEIRERFINQGKPISSHLLKRMQKDSRRGVRSIYQILKKQKGDEREEQLRLDSMLNFERVLWKSGVTHIAGVDEAGVGPLAGPVVAAAVIFPPNTQIGGVDDSKRLDAVTRDRLALEIRRKATSIGIGLAEVAEIDQINIYHAALLAMKRAVENLPVRPEHVLVDAREVPHLPIPQNMFFKGDGINFSIAAASIIAKTHRDQVMETLHCEYPQYGFRRHKGYSTQEHQLAIQQHGPSPVHRRSYMFIEELCGQYSDLFYSLQEKLNRIDSVAGLKSFELELEEVSASLGSREQRKLNLMVKRLWKVAAA